MKTLTKAVICIVLSFMICFTAIGYAQLTETLDIKGTAHYTMPEGLFIIAVEREGSPSRLDSETAEHYEYTTTVEATLDKSRSTSYTGSVTYKITVYNNTDKTYAYRGLYYSTSVANGNAIIGDKLSNNNMTIETEFRDGIIVEPDDELVFYATYTLGRRVDANKKYQTIVNYQFGINVNSLEEAREAVMDKFLNILNAPHTYELLYNRIDDKFSGAEWTSNYIGNVTASTSEDSRTVNELFAGYLQMMVNGVDSPITVLIKHENVDNDRQTGDDYTAVSGNQSFRGYGCEFTLYMTTSKLPNAGARETVYAAVFTCDRNADGTNGTWYMVGEPYQGTAQTVGYEGGNSSGSFDTGTWRSVVATYYPSENYSYSLPKDNTIQQVTQTVDPRAQEALEELFTEAKRILDENMYAGTGMVALEDAYNESRKIFTIADDGTITVDPTMTRVHLIPYIKKMNHVLKPFNFT